jgi:hypothetical protein
LLLSLSFSFSFDDELPIHELTMNSRVA